MVPFRSRVYLINCHPRDEHCIKLQSGDRIVLYTDGITEAHSPDGNGFYSQTRLEEVLRQNATASSEELRHRSGKRNQLYKESGAR